MYAKLYGYNTGYQTFAMLSDLKLGAVLDFEDLTQRFNVCFRRTICEGTAQSYFCGASQWHDSWGQ